jgi:hypothetical protein
MKTRPEIAAGEKIQHTGDLTIENNIGAGAELKITNGSLIIKGNIGDGAKIELVAPENKTNHNFNITNSISNVSFSGGGVHIFTSHGGFSNSVSADMAMGNSYIGNVNINNRIFSNDQVTKINNETYRINPSPYGYPRSGIVHATIDGVEYKGSEIVVKGKEVLVDGKKPNATTSNEVEPELPTGPFTMLIQGAIGNNVQLISGAESVVVEKNIGSECKINCSQGEFKGKDVGNGTHITTYKNIKLGQVASGCHLTNTHGSLEATRIGPYAVLNVRDNVEVKNSLGAYSHVKSEYGLLHATQVENNVTVNVRKEIKAEVIGHNCVLTSEYGGLVANVLGQNVNAHVREGIRVGRAGKASRLTSDYGTLSAVTLEEKVVVKVRQDARINNVQDRCRIESEYGGIHVEQTLGNNTLLEARQNILAKEIGNGNTLKSEYGSIDIREKTGTNNKITARQNIDIQTLGSESGLESDYGSINVTGLSGNHVTMEARENIRVSHIGSHARLTANYGYITTGNVGSYAAISARKDVNVNGSCPRDVHPESSYGRVYKNGPTQDYRHPEPEEQQDLELEIALAQSLQEEKPHFDAKPVNPNMNDISAYDLSQFSEYTKAYIQGFKHIEKNSLKIEALNLTDEQENKLSDGLVDALTHEIPEIPVRLNERLYNLKTLVFDLTKKGEDPFTRFKFKLEHIMPAHDVQEKLNKRIKKIEAERAARLQSQSGPGLFSTMKENDLAARKENDIAARKK